MTNYAQHVSRRVTPQSRAATPTQKQNSAGGFTFVVDDMMRLQRFLILGSDGGTYYAKETALTRGNAACVERCFDAYGIKAVEFIAELSESGRAPKNDAAIFALALGAAHSDAVVRKASLAALQRVCRIGTHLFQFVGTVNQLRGWGRGLRNAVAHWYRDKDESALAYQLVKYQRRGGWSHRDVLRKCHAEPRAAGGDERKHSASLRWAVVGNELGARDVVRKRGGEKSYVAVGDLPSLIAAYEEMKALGSEPVNLSTIERAVTLIHENRMTHEMVPSEFKHIPSIWEALLQHMPMGAMVRNLAKLTSVGVVAPMSEGSRLVASRLGDEGRIKKARLHPIAMLSALKVYESGHGVRGSLEWSPVPQVIDALDDGFYSAFDAVEPSDKRTLLAIDVSGSMTFNDIAGAPGITPRVGSAAMAMVTARTEPAYHFVGFAGSLTELPITKKHRLDDVIRTIEQLHMGRTDCAQPMIWAKDHGVKVDTFVVYTDNETWCGAIHPHQALHQYRNTTGINARLIVVGMTATEFTIADPDDAGMLDVVGFSTATPKVMADFARE